VGLVIYVIIQIVLAGFAVYILLNREAIRARQTLRKDKGWEKFAIVLLVPVLAFGYALLGGFPPKNDQLVFGVVVTVLLYVSAGLRWIRQSRSSIARANSAPLYFYRSSDGTICGPETGSRLSALLQRGFVSGDTLVAEESTPDAWKPLSDYSNIFAQQ
jgi:hypothetical protein